MNDIPKQTLTKDELIALRDRAWETLNTLITPQGIYASFDYGWDGPYHSWFGRDSAITTDFICAAIAYGGDSELAIRAQQALTTFMAWQGKTDDAATGEEKGKFPHEIRATFDNIDRVQHAPNTNRLPWYVDPADHLLKNWDSVDSTALWVVTMIRAHKVLKQSSYSEAVRASMRHGLEWIMKNIETYDGLVGFIGADQQPNRTYSGLHNQGWKDSFQIYQNDDGTLATHPIKDVLVNAEAWTALYEASEVFSDDAEFSSRLSKTAGMLRERFNDVQKGFLLPDKTYFAQAIDGNGKQLPQTSIDVGMCLWMGHEGMNVIDPQYIDEVTSKVKDATMFNPRAGIRDYGLGTVFKQGTLYHGSSHTYWPFASILVARGLDKFDYHEEAAEVITATLSAVERLGSNIEMFVETLNLKLVSWHHPKVGQRSSAEQAWTAAAVYFGALYLLKDD
jgi:glycogen debranching enzyme